MNVLELSEQEIIRRNSLNEMRAMGIDPYPAAEYVTNAFSTDIKAEFKDDEEPRQVSVAGRIMSRRVMGKASFVELQDSKGRIQVYITRDDICPDENKDLYNVVFKRLLDLGDFIGIEGFVFRTQTGEVSIHAKKLTVLSKSIRPLPIVKYKDGVAYDKFEDPELRYRQRYVDLVVNDGVKDIFLKRNKVYNSMREYFNSKGYIEVETPILQAIAGGAAARPFITHHNALDIPLYMRIASELYLKRLIVGGFEGVYEIGKNFRNEGMDRTHNPEFTCMEIYVAYKDYNWMMKFTENMIEKICLDVNGTTEVKVGDNVMLGYYKNEEATAQAIDKEGWLHTGDLGIMDAEGNVFIKGRSKNMLLGPSGQNIYPEEIEDQLNNLPLVCESIVIQQKDNRLAALVYPDFDDAYAHGLNDADIERIMEENRVNLNAALPAYSQIARIKIYPEEFEKTPKKSIKRFLYKDVN